MGRPPFAPPPFRTRRQFRTESRYLAATSGHDLSGYFHVMSPGPIFEAWCRRCRLWLRVDEQTGLTDGSLLDYASCPATGG